jgi:hypothetical protein
MIYLPENDHDRLKLNSRRLNKSLAQLIREAVQAYLSHPSHTAKADPMAIVGIVKGPPGHTSEHFDEALGQLMHRAHLRKR